MAYSRDELARMVADMPPGAAAEALDAGRRQRELRPSKTKGWTSESGMPGEGLQTPGYGVKEEPNGRALPPTTRYLHARTHPVAVEGCFGCRVASVGVALAPHASTRGDGVGLASSLKLEHQAMAKAEPDRYAPASSRWV